jgi:hypothetical protein
MENETAAAQETVKKFFGDWEALAKKEFLEGNPIATVLSKDIPIQDGEIITTAINLIKENPIGTIKTSIGDVQITNDSIRTSFNHTRYPNKLAVLPKLQAILEGGIYLRNLPDIDGGNTVNHYFAAPVKIDGNPKYVFIRVKEKSSGKSFYVHEVFAEEEIKKSDALNSTLSKLGDRMQTVGPKQDRIKFSDLYRSILNDVLSVNCT